MKKLNTGFRNWLVSPYLFLKMIWSLLVLTKTAIHRGVVELKELDATASIEPDLLKGKILYKKMAANFKKPQVIDSWHRFVLTGIAIQGFLLIMCVLQLFYFNPLVLLEALSALIISIVSFGYKPYMIENQLYVSAFQYVTKIPQHRHCLMLWKYYNILEK